MLPVFFLFSVGGFYCPPNHHLLPSYSFIFVQHHGISKNWNDTALMPLSVGSFPCHQDQLQIPENSLQENLMWQFLPSIYPEYLLKQRLRKGMLFCMRHYRGLYLLLPPNQTNHRVSSEVSNIPTIQLQSESVWVLRRILIPTLPSCRQKMEIKELLYRFGRRFSFLCCTLAISMHYYSCRKSYSCKSLLMWGG